MGFFHGIKRGGVFKYVGILQGQGKNTQPNDEKCKA
jgi:hypothetical protein